MRTLIFDKNHPSWVDDCDYRRSWLKLKELYLNDLLKAHRHITNLEIYAELGFDMEEGEELVKWENRGFNHTIIFETEEINNTFHVTPIVMEWIAEQL